MITYNVLCIILLQIFIYAGQCGNIKPLHNTYGAYDIQIHKACTTTSLLTSWTVNIVLIIILHSSEIGDYYSYGKADL